MKINVSRLLADKDLGSSTFTRRRPSTSLTTDGVARNDYDSDIIVATGIVQPAATTDATLLPEGVRISDVQAFYTNGDVSVGGPDQLPDVLEYEGLSYRVLHVQDFGSHGMRRALAQRFHAGETSTEVRF